MKAPPPIRLVTGPDVWMETPGKAPPPVYRPGQASSSAGESIGPPGSSSHLPPEGFLPEFRADVAEAAEIVFPPNVESLPPGSMEPALLQEPVTLERDALGPTHDEDEPYNGLDIEVAGACPGLTRSVATKYGGKDEGDGCVAPTLCEKVVKGIESSARVLKAQNKAAELKVELPPKPKGAGRGSGEPPP